MTPRISEITATISDREPLPALPILLLRARAVVAGRFNKELRQHGLTEQQWRVLLGLSIQSNDVTTLAEHADLLPSSVSRIIRDLRDRDLLTSAPDLVDARRTLVTITCAGRALVGQTLNDIQKIYEEIHVQFGPDNVLELRMSLAALINALSGASEGDAPESSDHPDKA